jgi:CBS domain-containing protein
MFAVSLSAGDDAAALNRIHAMEDTIMQLREIMTSDVECIGPDNTLREAAEKMRALDVGPLPVCDNDRLVGILTDRDIVVRAIAEGHDPRTTAVREAMTESVDYCFEDDDTAAAARKMRERQIRRLAVLNRDKRLVGIVSLGDLAVKTGDDAETGETLEEISEPAKPR